jgi:hypothetical protein
MRGILDHPAGQARSAPVKPISGVVLRLLSVEHFFMRSGASMTRDLLLGSPPLVLPACFSLEGAPAQALPDQRGIPAGWRNREESGGVEDRSATISLERWLEMLVQPLF